MIEDAPDTTTGIMIDALQYPLNDKTISVTTRARPFVNELLADAWEAGRESGAAEYWDDFTPTNPYRSQP